MLDRLGQQSGVVMKAWGNSMPWSASSARVRGMMAAAEGEWVAPVVSQRWSSVRMKTMFGRSGCGFGPQRSTHTPRSVRRQRRSAALSTPLPGGGSAAAHCGPTAGTTTPLASWATMTKHLLRSLSSCLRALRSAFASGMPFTRSRSLRPT